MKLTVSTKINILLKLFAKVILLTKENSTHRISSLYFKDTTLFPSPYFHRMGSLKFFALHFSVIKAMFL
jgi:hypothetical protein